MNNCGNTADTYKYIIRMVDAIVQWCCRTLYKNHVKRKQSEGVIDIGAANPRLFTSTAKVVSMTNISRVEDGNSHDDSQRVYYCVYCLSFVDETCAFNTFIYEAG